MAHLGKRKGKVKEEEYALSATNELMLNYSVYIMKKTEKLLTFAALFLVGAAVGFIFYGGIGKDEYGEATTVTYIMNAVVMCLFGCIAGRLFLPVRVSGIINKRKKKLRVQFIDLLDSLSTSVASGKNIPAAFLAARADMLIQYPEDSYIIKEIDQINAGIANSISVETLLMDFGKRSGIKDVENFGRVFETAYRKGGNIKEIVRNSHEILSGKIAIEMDIETKVASSKREQNIMCIMPIVLIAMIKLAGSDFAANFTTPTGLISTTVAIAIFVGSYFVSRVIMRIEV